MKKIKSWIMRYPSFLIVLAVIAVATTSVSAYYIRNSGEVKNDFTPAVSVTPEIIEETFDGQTKKNVYFKVGDTGYPVYVRTAIVVTWQNKDGVVYFSKPVENNDYTISLNTADWEEKASTVDSNEVYHYLKDPVESGESTPYLIYECKQVGDPPAEGYTLNVDILVQTVQAIGYTDEDPKEEVPTTYPAYMDAWQLS